MDRKLQKTSTAAMVVVLVGGHRPVRACLMVVGDAAHAEAPIITMFGTFTRPTRPARPPDPSAAHGVQRSCPRHEPERVASPLDSSTLPYHDMFIALTGGTGALGAVVLDTLLRAGHRVRALTRQRDTAPPREHPDLEWSYGDLDEPAALDALVAGADAILHAAYAPIEAPPPAGRSLAEQLIQANIGGTVRLIERTPATRASQLIYVSSLAVYGVDSHCDPRARTQPIDEDFCVWPREFYGAHKAALEQLVIAGAGEPGMNNSVFRIGCVLGRYADLARNKLAIVVREAQEHGQIRTQLGAYVVTAQDAATTLVGALGDTTVRGQVFNTFDRWLDFATLAPRLSDLLNRPIEAVCAPAPAPEPPISNDRIASRQPGWQTEAQLDDLLRATIADLSSA